MSYLSLALLTLGSLETDHQLKYHLSLRARDDPSNQGRPYQALRTPSTWGHPSMQQQYHGNPKDKTPIDKELSPIAESTN